MKRHLVFFSLLISVLVAVSYINTAKAEFTSEYLEKFKSPESDLVLFPAMTWMLEAPRAYFRVFETWPETWGTIEQAGLIQVELLNPEGGTFDMDDHTWNGMTDYHYVYQGTGKCPMIMTATKANSNKVIHAVLDEPAKTYLEWFEWASGFARERAAVTNADYSDYNDFTEYEGDQQLLSLFAIRDLLDVSIGWYCSLHKQPPKTWKELMESGLAPIDENSINPKTGERFKGDGSPYDFEYRLSEDGKYFLRVVDRDGNPITNVGW